MLILVGTLCPLSTNTRTPSPSSSAAVWIWISVIAALLMFADARKLPDIRWESRNRIFDISNTDHVNQAAILDRVTILCPGPASIDEEENNKGTNFPSPNASSTFPYEFSKLFMVSRDGYEKCVLLEEKQLGVCATPEQQSSMSLVFRDFSPLPSALTFEQGRSYFVITTSNGLMDGINNTQGGLCETKNMKLKFDIISDSSPVKQTGNTLLSQPSTNSSNSSAFNQPATILNSEASPILYVIHTVDSPALEEGDNLPIISTSKNISDGGFTFTEGDESSGTRSLYYRKLPLICIIFIATITSLI